MPTTNNQPLLAFSSVRFGYDRKVVDRLVPMIDGLPELRRALTEEGHNLTSPIMKYLSGHLIALFRGMDRGEIDALEIVSLRAQRFQIHGVYCDPLTWQAGLSVLIQIDPAGKVEVGDPLRHQVVRVRAGIAWTIANTEKGGIS